jgi:hypothetical protein
VQLAYTWSHEIDEVGNDLNGVSDPFNIKYDRGNGGLDRRNIFNANYIYNLPFYAHSSNGFLHAALGGWSVSGITVAQSGTGLYITYNGPDTLGLGGGTPNRPNQVAPISYPKTVNAWFSASSFASPVAPWNGGPNQGFGNAAKGDVVGPGLFNFNLSVFKAIPLTSRERGPMLELRFEGFNVFNHTEFQNVDTGSTDGNFGAVVSTYDPRTLQLGAKFSF